MSTYLCECPEKHVSLDNKQHARAAESRAPTAGTCTYISQPALHMSEHIALIKSSFASINIFPHLYNIIRLYSSSDSELYTTCRQGRVRQRARWAIAQGPRLSRGPKKGEKVKKAYENRLSRDLGVPQIY